MHTLLLLLRNLTGMLFKEIITLQFSSPITDAPSFHQFPLFPVRNVSMYEYTTPFIRCNSYIYHRLYAVGRANAHCFSSYVASSIVRNYTLAIDRNIEMLTGSEGNTRSSCPMRCKNVDRRGKNVNILRRVASISVLPDGTVTVSFVIPPIS